MDNDKNKVVCTVGIFWNGDVKDISMGNWQVLDEHDRHDGRVYMSFYRSKEDAERGYERWVARQRKRYEDAKRMKCVLEEAGVANAYPSVMKEFMDCTGLYEGCDVGDYIPKAHAISESTVENWNRVLEHFSEKMYEVESLNGD